MPHTWMLECLELYNINRRPSTFIKNLMEMLKTTLQANSNQIAQVKIKSAYTKEMLYPYCCSPLRRVAMDTASEVEESSATSSRWMASSCMPRLRHPLTDPCQRVYCKDTGMPLGLDKSARMVSKRVGSTLLHFYWLCHSRTEVWRWFSHWLQLWNWEYSLPVVVHMEGSFLLLLAHWCWFNT